MYNVYLSQVNYSTGSGRYKGYWIPYSVGTLWSYSSQFPQIQSNFVLKELLFKREGIADILNRIDNPAIVGFSNYVWNYEYNKVVARSIKEKFPNCIITFGGPQTTKRPLETNFFENHPYVDTVSLGEGENNFKQLLEDYLKGNVKKIYEFNRLEDLNFVSPYLAGIFDDIIYKNPNITWNAVLETNRGCPFKCTFCDWGSLTYAKLKKFNLDKIFQELEWMGKHKIGYVTIADANFGCFKERDMYITEKMAEVQKEYGYPETVDATWYKNLSIDVIEIVKKFISSGFNRGISLSLQSLNEETLVAIERSNMKLNKFKDILDVCNQQQIPSYTELILGLPHETKQSWKEGLCRLIEAGQHNSIESWTTQILENSELNAQRDVHQLKTSFLKNYYTSEEDTVSEKAEIVIATKYLPFDDLIESWMYSWMITNFHTFGWTQIYSIFLYKYSGLQYLEFYDSLFTELKNTDQYNLVQNRVSKYLSGEDTVDYSGHGLMWASQEYYHRNRRKTQKFILDFINKYKLLQNFSKTLSTNIIVAQNAFVTQYNKDTVSVNLDHNLYEYIYKNTELVNKKSSYNLYLKEQCSDELDYYNKFYFRRRQGWGKYRIEW